MRSITLEVMNTSGRPGEILRDWRHRSGLSQLALSTLTGVSARHLSFLETGRSTPSTAMVVHLSDHLDIPLRERNRILVAAGHAPLYSHHDLDDDALAAVRGQLSQMVRAVEPAPAVILDRHWNMVEANGAIGVLLDGCAADLLAAPVNVIRLALHPQGMAPRIVNLAEVRAHLIGQVRRRADRTGDPALDGLVGELSTYGGTGDADAQPGVADDAVVLPLRLTHRDGELRFFSTAAALTSARDVTISELTVETFHPADAHTREFLSRRAGSDTA